MRRACSIALAAAIAGHGPGCVIVSSSRSSASDAGFDAARPDAGPPPDAGPVPDAGAVCDRNAVLVSIGERVVLPTYRTFEERAAELEAAATQYASSLSDSDLAALRDAWIRAMDVWEEAELMQLGPAGMPPSEVGGAAGGLDLRDEIYAWDDVSLCRIDQAIVARDYENPDAFAARDVDVRGLLAMEYLIFGQRTSNACTPAATINTSGAWAALVDSGELPARRAAYARTLAILVHRTARQLRQAWEPSGGDFVGQLGRGDGTYMGALDALNAVSDALIFYADRRLKDMKIATAAGLSLSCPSDFCPEALESQQAGRSREHILANLRAIRAIVLGGPSASEGAGFDDLLRCAGCAATADRLLAAIESAIAYVEAMPSLTVERFSEQVEALRGAHPVVRAITDLLKTEFVTCLDLDLPFSGTGSDDAD